MTPTLTAAQKQFALQIGMGLTIATFAGAMGYILGSSYRKAHRWQSLVSNCQGRSLASIKGADQDWEDAASGRNAADGQQAAYFAILEKDHLDDKSHKLAAVFPHSDVGRALAHVTTLSDFSPGGDTPEGAFLAEENKFLESEPSEAFQVIHTHLGKLGSDFSSERQLLIQLVGRLDLDISEKSDFLFEELNKGGKINKVVALSSLIQLGVDPTSIEAALRQSISGQVSYTSRLLLLSVYEAKYPEQARKIRDDFGL
jgi:hypothetical protein